MTAEVEKLDKIHVRDLHLRCFVGTSKEERRERQDVLINMTLYVDVKAAGRTDRIEDTVDYRALKKRVMAMVAESTCSLIEHLAERIAGVCLAEDRVRRVAVTVDKPGALRFARSVAVEIVRDRKDGD